MDAWHDCNESMLMTCRLEGEAASRWPQTRRLCVRDPQHVRRDGETLWHLRMPSLVNSSASLVISTPFYAFSSPLHVLLFDTQKRKDCLLGNRGIKLRSVDLLVGKWQMEDARRILGTRLMHASVTLSGTSLAFLERSQQLISRVALHNLS